MLQNVRSSLVSTLFLDVDTDLYKLIMSPQYLTTEHIQMFLYQMLAAAYVPITRFYSDEMTPHSLSILSVLLLATISIRSM